MKRWNQRGSTYAKERMAELRERKLRIRRTELANQYEAKFGTHWWPVAKAAGVAPSQDATPHIAWLEAALANAPAHVG